MKRILATIALVVTAVLVVVVGIVRYDPSAPAKTGLNATAAKDVGPLSVAVDDTLQPETTEVDPIAGVPRHVGVMAAPEGDTTEFVLDEVIVHTASRSELDEFLARWEGTVLDSFGAAADGQDHLVRVDTSGADTRDLDGDLAAAEPGLTGTFRVGDDRALRLLALAAAEWRRGTEVVIDSLSEPTSIEDGQVYESEDIDYDHDNDPATAEIPKNVFDWKFMQYGGAMNIGVGEAWQLLQTRDKLKPQIRYMVLDGGFNPNFDFPKKVTIRKGEWGEKNNVDCGDSACPWHGTDVVLAAMGTVGNGYGTAGPAGPVVEHLIAINNSYDYWTWMRRLDDLSREYRPHVVNLSFKHDTYVGSAHLQKWTDRRMGHVKDAGALIVAAAGNSGKSVDTDRLWMPCESKHVMCVGGMTKSGKRDPGSNYGEGDSSRSVEIYGPMETLSINDPNKSALDFTTRTKRGTSFASPFVGGVAALVMAADPSLGPDEVRKILNDSANVGGLGSEVTGSQRRVNALAAVAKALDVTVGPPKVTIEAPKAGKEIGVEDWVDLRGSAYDFMGRTLPIRWESDRDGVLATQSVTSVPPLSEGTHRITATVVDAIGQTTTESVTVEVVDTPPQVQMVSPSAGYETLEGANVTLTGTTLDPDTWSPLPNNDVKWEVRRSGALVYEATGHQANLSATKVTPGSYQVKFIAGGVTVQRSFTVAELPGDAHQPVATITTPSSNITKQAYNGHPQTIHFSGSATDVENGAIGGTRFQWTASSGTVTKVLCEGSNVPHDGGPGGIVQPKSCASFDAQLGMKEGDIQSTTWTVRLKVWDSSGNWGEDTVTVKIQYVTG